MSESEPESLPDIDAGLEDLSTETTAADLLRQQGQRKKLKVINQKQLKAQIQEWIKHAINEIMADNAERFEDSERNAMIEQAEVRVQDLMRRNAEMEADRQRESEARRAAEERLQQLAAEHGADDELQNSIAQFQERLEKAELVAEEAQQDLLVVEQDLDNTKKMFQQTLSEKDRLNDTVRQHMLHTTDLVAKVLALDADYYASQHQQQNPADEEAEGAEAFYHDFAVGAEVIETLSGDLERLRDITEGEAEGSGAHAQLLERDLELIEQLKQGSLSAVDVAAPVENLIEALDGARGEVVELARATGKDEVGIAALPEGDGDPAEVLAGATGVVRQLTAELASERAKVGELSGQSAEHDRANQALRDNMIRTGDLVQGVLALDSDYYAGRHQEENPVDESTEGADVFYHDFDVGAKVIETLSQDLNRLRELTKDEEKYSGLLDSDLALLEQLKEGSLSAVDVAEPVANLLEALGGARDEAEGLGRDAGEALGMPGSGSTLGTLPDPDGEPAEVLARTTQVARELAASLAAERKRLFALKALADEADELRSTTEVESQNAKEQVGRTLAAVRAAAEAAGLEVPESLTCDPEEDGDPEQPVEDAKAVLERMGAALAQERATVAELSRAVESVLDEQDGSETPTTEASPAEASPAEASPAEGADAADLGDKLRRLGGAYAALRASYRRSCARNVALADQLQALARDLHPEYGDDDPIAVGISEVDQAVQEEVPEEPQREQEERLNSALDHLVEAMRRRATELGEHHEDEVQALANDLLATAREDDDLADEEPVSQLQSTLEDQGSGDEASTAGRDPAAVIAASKQLIARLRERQQALRSERDQLADRLAGSEAANRQLNKALQAAAESVLANRVEGVENDDLAQAKTALDEQLSGSAAAAAALEVPADELELEQDAEPTAAASDEALAEAQHAARLAAAGAAVVDRLRQREQELGERVLELEGELTRAQEMADQLATVEQQLAAERERGGELGEECDRLGDELTQQKEQLRQARADLEEFRAREETHGGRSNQNVQRLKEELAAARKARDDGEAAHAEAVEEFESTIAGLRARCEDLDNRIEERDNRIESLQRQLDEEQGARVDTKDGQARLQALQTELEAERNLRAELQRQVDDYKGGVGQELESALRRRDELAQQVRQLEGDLGEQRGQVESLKVAKDKLRADLNQQLERLRGELDEEREARERAEQTDDELHEEIAGLKAKLRALTEGES